VITSGGIVIATGYQTTLALDAVFRDFRQRHGSRSIDRCHRTQRSQFSGRTAALACLPTVALGSSNFASINVAATQSFPSALTGVSVAVQQFTPNPTAGGTTNFGAFAVVIAFDLNIEIK